jgi:hypothetical protein
MLAHEKVLKMADLEFKGILLVALFIYQLFL